MAGLPIDDYFDELRRLANAVETTDHGGRQVGRNDGFEWAIKTGRRVTAESGKLIFIGNGGSAGIASHLAIDFAKNGGMRAIALNDAAALTCLGNDFGYEQVFAKQLEWQARPGDMLVAISSSGRSPNILNAAVQARSSGCAIVTFSGFDTDNPLRATGDMNFYVASHHYGLVEISHLSLCHAILDFASGWRGQREQA